MFLLAARARGRLNRAAAIIRAVRRCRLAGRGTLRLVGRRCLRGRGCQGSDATARAGLRQGWGGDRKGKGCEARDLHGDLHGELLGPRVARALQEHRAGWDSCVGYL